jgi:xylan 1,4-beta-xylosidase
MSYWVFTDIFEEPGPRFEAFHGGFGLMNLHGIRKPAYFACEYLNRLGPTELKSNDGWAPTVSSRRSCRCARTTSTCSN